LGHGPSHDVKCGRCLISARDGAEDSIHSLQDVEESFEGFWDRELQVARSSAHMGIVVEAKWQGGIGCHPRDGWLEVSGDGAEVRTHVC